MHIPNEILSRTTFLSLGLENCDEFRIPIQAVLDFGFDEPEIDKHGYSIVHDGYLILSKNIFAQPSQFAVSEIAEDFPGFYSANCLYTRLTTCCDIVQIHFIAQDEITFGFHVDYDPIENLMTGCEVEYSNCASAEPNENGDLLVLFGKSSHAFQRIDHDYFRAIQGLAEFLPQKFRGILTVNPISMKKSASYFDGTENEMFAEMRIRNKEYKEKYLPLRFFEVTEFAFDFVFECEENLPLYLSPTANGQHFVQFGERCNFFCNKIEVCFEF